MATQFFVLLLISMTLQYSSASSGGFGFTIHRSPNSPLSHLYNRPNASAADNWNSIYQRSIARYNFLQSRIHNDNSISPDGIQVPVVHGTGRTDEYETTVKMGTPPVEVTLIVDTGSGLTWIQCLPCRQCYPQDEPIFDPSHSVSFHRLPCDFPQCNVDIPAMSCESNICQYYQSYGDQSTTRGEVATEDFIFNTAEGGTEAVPGIVFGCGHSNMGQYTAMQQGILGLDMSTTSLLMQLGTRTNFRFSYCLVPYNSVGASQILFGDKAKLEGGSTSLVVNNSDTFYYVDLVDMSVGGGRLNLPSGTFNRTSDGGGVIMDTGTPFSHLENSAFEKLAWMLKESVKLEFVEDGSNFLCFKGSRDDLVDEKIPSLTFHFAGGLDLIWPPSYSFLPIGTDTVCLTIMSAKDRHASFSVLGNFVTQNINVGIDTLNSKVYMSPQDCLTFGGSP